MELFWSKFSCIPTEYGEIRSICPYSFRIRENTDTFYAVNISNNFLAGIQNYIKQHCYASYVSCLTNNRLSSDSNPDCNKIHEIIETLGPNKAYRRIVISIRILKSCISSIVQPPSLIFQNCLKFVTSFGKRAISSEFIKRTAV